MTSGPNLRSSKEALERARAGHLRIGEQLRTLVGRSVSPVIVAADQSGVVGLSGLVAGILGPIDAALSDLTSTVDHVLGTEIGRLDRLLPGPAGRPSVASSAGTAAPAAPADAIEVDPFRQDVTRVENPDELLPEGWRSEASERGAATAHGDGPDGSPWRTDPETPLLDGSPEADGPINGQVFEGANNTNVVVRTDAGWVLVRRAKPHQRGGNPRLQYEVWHEGDTLARIGPHLPFVPRLLHRSSDVQVLEFRAGRSGVRCSPRLARLTASALGRMAGLDAEQVPALPEGWPVSGDSVAYGGMMLAHGEAVWGFRRERYRELYEAIGFGDDPLRPLHDLVKSLTPRPYGLLHNDLHTGNMLVAKGEPGLTIVDWEFASYGDPLSDLANHLEKTDYTPAETRLLVAGWMHEAGPERSRGLVRDLPVYRRLHASRSTIVQVRAAANVVRRAVECDLPEVRHIAMAQAEKLTNEVNAVNHALRPARPRLEPWTVADHLMRFATTHATPTDR